MQFNLVSALQVCLIVLVIALVVAVVQLTIILIDVRSVTKRVKKAAQSIKIIEYLFDGDDAKKIARAIQKTVMNMLQAVGRTARRWIGGGKNG